MPVATADHQRLDAVGHRPVGQVPGLVGVAADQVAHGEARLPAAGAVRRSRPRGRPCPCRRSGW